MRYAVVFVSRRNTSVFRNPDPRKPRGTGRMSPRLQTTGRPQGPDPKGSCAGGIHAPPGRTVANLLHPNPLPDLPAWISVGFCQCYGWHRFELASCGFWGLPRARETHVPKETSSSQASPIRYRTAHMGLVVLRTTSSSTHSRRCTQVGPTHAASPGLVQLCQ